MVCERIAVQSEHCFVCLSLQLEPLGIDISCFEINLAIVKLECRDFAIPIDGNIVWMRWHKRIYHHSVEAAIDLLGDVAEHDLHELLACIDK
jgi:hypothetical protein